MTLERLVDWLAGHQTAAEAISILAIALLCVLVFYLTKHLLLALLSKAIEKSRVKWDDIILEKGVFTRLAYLAPILVIFHFAFVIPGATHIIERGALALSMLIFIIVISAFLNAVNEIYDSMEISKGRPIRAYLQVIKILLYILGGIAFIATLLDKSPWVFLSGIGAMTAILILVFKDTILSFVASLQIVSYNMVQVGDWIDMPKYGADGDVIDISLHTIKVQNWDKTITTIPTHRLIEDSFKNWRGMMLSGGRRIKRNINIDISSIRFCTEEMLESFEKIQLLKNYIQEKKKELERYNRESGIDDTALVNGRRMTNVGTFRRYVWEYLWHHPRINQKMTFLIRQLNPGPQGLPLEIYVFTDTTEWSEYEDIQADIFDHILAVVPIFDLTVFQSPSGYDVRELAGK